MEQNIFKTLKINMLSNNSLFFCHSHTSSRKIFFTAKYRKKKPGHL